MNDPLRTISSAGCEDRKQIAFPSLFGGHSVMENSFQMPKSCRGCSLPFSAMYVVACLSAFLLLQSLLSWPRTHAVSRWVQLVGVALRVSDLPRSSLHREILADNVQDALAGPSFCQWAAQVVQHVRSLGLPAPFAPDGTVLIDKSSFRRHAAGKSHEVWQGLHASPRSAPSKGANLCTYHRWFARIGPVPEPYCQLPLSDRCMRRLFSFWHGAHTLPIEMGRSLRMARVARVCPLCPGMHVGDERQCNMQEDNRGLVSWNGILAVV